MQALPAEPPEPQPVLQSLPEEVPPQPPLQEPSPQPQPAPEAQEPSQAPQDHSELARHLLDLAQSEPDPELRLRLNQLAALNAAFGLEGQSEQPEEPA